MITIKQLTKYISGEPLFNKVSFALHRGDKVGLVGPNGSGKTTLLSILAGRIETDEGSITIEKEQIGYVPQSITYTDNETISGFLNTTEATLQKVLKEVGLEKLDVSSPVMFLSGGQKTRLAIARCIITNPSVLLLDEPTNHLDTKGLAWLESYIAKFRGAVLVVSHDRTFLDNCVNKIFEIDKVNNSFNVYLGGYSDFLTEKEKRNDSQEDAYKRQQREKRRLELWLARKREQARIHADPSAGRQIRAMEKRLEREIYSQTIARPKDYRSIRSMELSGETSNSKLIASCSGIGKQFGEKWPLWDISFEIRGKERVLLGGENGSGKTTLLKILNGEIAQDKGTIKIGTNVSVGYFAQEHETLDPNKTVMEEFLNTEQLQLGSKDPRATLGSFLFSGDNIFKKVSVLSQGEKVRLLFCKLTNQKNELLLLDEPTNHLDITSREVIEQALNNYNGAICTVSHDRYFIEKLRIKRRLTLTGGIAKEY